jgi:peptidoglycan/xylan/chitin deacetylase (PgdA/CDA1 family)
MQGRKQLPEKSFLLTFDDGARDSFYPVDPILAALGYHATAFILPEHSLGDHSTYYLNKKDLDYMLSTGRWTIESHGQNIHTSLPITADGATKENALSNRLWLARADRLETHDEYAIRITNDLAESKDNLEKAFGISVDAFAFPFGDYGQNKSNDPQAENTILAAARRNYSLAFYQNWSKEDFIFNYPGTSTDAFMIKRIAVNPAWTGEDLLKKLEASSPKPLPYKDALAADNGWQNGWGLMSLTDQGLRLSAAASTTGSLALLDGSYTWSDYTVEMPIEWTTGYAILLFDMQNDREGRACVFGADGLVQLQDRTKDDILIRRELRIPDVSGGTHTIGVVTNGTTTACTFDGKYVIDATLPALSGGVGVEAWSPELGAAEVFIKSTSAYKSE